MTWLGNGLQDPRSWTPALPDGRAVVRGGRAQLLSADLKS